MAATPKRRVNMVVRRYQAGRTRRDIAIELKMKPETVKKILEAQGFEFIPEWRNKLSPEQEQQVIARYPEVKSSTALAKEFGCDRVTILNIVRRAGLATQRRGNPYREFTPEQVDRMVALYEMGQSQTQLAALFSTGQTVISRILKERGVTIRRKIQRELHPNWRGGRVKVGDYIGVYVEPDSPYAAMRQAGGYVLEHRMVMAEALGRPLMEHETVHHINGDHSDNRLENLQLRIGKHGKGVAYCCAACGSRNLVPCEIS